MFEAIVITLREGIEAALVIGIIVAFLRREGRERHLPAVWAGIAAAVVASLIGAYVLYRVAVNEEAFEGLLYLGSAILVASLLVWMWRHSHALSAEVKGSLGKILDRGSSRSVGLGLFLFTFVMVFREGIETVAFLAALSLTTRGLLAFSGAAIGIAAAVAFGVLFVRGSLKVDLKRFFAITGITLAIFTLQLLVNGYHELSEAGWVPANERSMAVVGPLVRNEVFFIAAVVILPLLLLLVPGRAGKAPAESSDANPAERRLALAQGLKRDRARKLAGVLGIVILAVLGFGFVYSRPPATLSPATPLVISPGTNGSDASVRIPLAELPEGKLARFSTEVSGRSIRLIAIKLDQGEYVAAFDACLICGTHGYYQEGSEVVCLHCGSAIYAPSIGNTGGCNPIPLPFTIEPGALVFAAADLLKGPSFDGTATSPTPGGGHHGGSSGHAGHGG